jgi:hypothetical protein
MIFLGHHPVNVDTAGAATSGPSAGSWIIFGLIVLLVIGVIYWLRKTEKLKG